MQQDASQQSAGATQESHAASPDTNAQGAQTTTPDGQAQQTTASNVQGQGQTQGQAQGQTSGTDFSQLLQQQIAEAIQPVLADFRREMTQTVEQQAPTARLQPTAEQAQTTVTQQIPAAASTATAATEATASQTSAQTQGLVQEALQPALKAVERQSEELLNSVLASALTGLLTETTRIAIQQSAERGLHALMQKLFAATPDGAVNQEMQLKIERTLQMILRETLDVVFAEHLRTSLQQNGQAVIQSSFHGDFSSAVKNVGDIVKALGEALLTVLRREGPTVIRLALALAILALESSLARPHSQQEHGSQPQGA